jgi:hypothetical protein
MGIVAGVFIIIISIAHNIYGEKKQVPELKKLSNDSIMIGSLRIMIFQGGILLFAVGIIQVLVSANIIQLPGISAYFPVGIILINFITSLIIADSDADMYQSCGAVKGFPSIVETIESLSSFSGPETYSCLLVQVKARTKAIRNDAKDYFIIAHF